MLACSKTNISNQRDGQVHEFTLVHGTVSLPVVILAIGQIVVFEETTQLSMVLPVPSMDPDPPRMGCIIYTICRKTFING